MMKKLSLIAVLACCGTLFAPSPAIGVASASPAADKDVGNGVRLAGPDHRSDSPASASRTRRKGALILKIAGLPRKERAALTITGPRLRGSGKPFRRKVTRSGIVRIKRLNAGIYRIKVHRVKLKKASGTIRRGAVASPTRRNMRVKVGAGKPRQVNVRYGTIINPGVRGVAKRIVSVLGDPLDPQGVVLKGKRSFPTGTIVSAPPSSLLPRGLLAHVTSVHRQPGQIVVALRPASIYDVAPNMAFDVPLRAEPVAGMSRFVRCEGFAGQGIDPYARISNLRASGGWVTQRVWFANVPTGATVKLHFRASAGFSLDSTTSVTCSIPLPSIAVHGAIGPIPVYGGVKPSIGATAKAGASLSSEGSTEVMVGANVGGFPPSAKPLFSFGSPKFSFKSAAFAETTANVGLDAQIGIGVANAANLHASLGNSLAFSGKPGQCSWDLSLGSFSAGGEILGVGISTPATTPLYQRNLWRNRCGGPPAPAPPALAVPLTRAEMFWDTDADIDLYIWDQAGNLASYRDKDAIPSAELIQDIIPGTGDLPESPEIFRELADPGRTFTYGICLYRGRSTSVTVRVHDPWAPARTFQHQLSGHGDHRLVATSPGGTGFAPSPSWCRHTSP